MVDIIPSMSALTLRLLGSPEVKIDGVVVPMRQRKPLALLVYLAVEGGQHSRDALTELLYPNRGRDSAYSAFRQCLFVLRGGIDEGRLVTDRDTVSLSATAWTDVEELKRLESEAKEAERVGDIDFCLDRLGAATELFRGEFLAGFYLRDAPMFESWQLAREEGLRSTHVQLLDRLVGLHEERGETRLAISRCRTLLALDPLEEDVHRRLMLLLALSGQRAAALKQYDRCSELLKKELGEAPEPETVKLKERIESKKISKTETPSPAQLTGASHQASVSPRKKTIVHPPPTNGEITLLTDPPSHIAAMYDSVDAAVVAVIERGESIAIRTVIHRGSDHRTALLLELAHPGQVLLSAAAARDLSDPPPRGVSCKSLGVHRLKDLGPAMEIIQLQHPTLTDDFPHLRSLDSCPNNLESPPTAFLGRSDEIEGVMHMLVHEETRLLTLTGPGGTGKTRLAMQVAAGVIDRFKHGVFFVDLAPLSDPEQVPGAILAALGAGDPGAQRRSFDRVIEYLRPKELLLVLDNFEHLLDAAHYAAESISDSPRLKILATSREALRLSSEQRYPVPPFGVAELAPKKTIEELTAQDAVRLFHERARLVQPDFEITPDTAPVIAEICTRLDGLPLAIELNAALVRYLTPLDLLERLKARLASPVTPSQDHPDRHRTLEATIAWSYNQLDETTKAVFRRLSVFAGGFTLDAAARVCAGQCDNAEAEVFALLDKNLLTWRGAAQDARYGMLQTIRDFALERLEEGGERNEAENAHAYCYLEFAERVESKLNLRDEVVWRERLEKESENIRVSLIWFRNHHQGRGLRLAAALSGYWWSAGEFFRASRAWLEYFRETCRESGDHESLAKVCYGLGWIRFLTGAIEPGWGASLHACWQEGLDHARASGNKALVAKSLSVVALTLAREELRPPDMLSTNREAKTAWDEAVRIARESRDPAALVRVLVMASVGTGRVGVDYSTRLARAEEAAAIAEENGNPEMQATAAEAMGRVLGRLAEAEQATPVELAEAEPWCKKEMEINVERKCISPGTYNSLGAIYVEMGKMDLAEPLFLRALSVMREGGWIAHNIAHYLFSLSLIARWRGDQRRAVRLMASSHASAPSIGLRNTQEPLPEVVKLIQPLRDGVLEEEWSVGYAMTREEALEYAMEGAAEYSPPVSH